MTTTTPVNPTAACLWELERLVEKKRADSIAQLFHRLTDRKVIHDEELYRRIREELGHREPEEEMLPPVATSRYYNGGKVVRWVDREFPNAEFDDATARRLREARRRPNTRFSAQKMEHILSAIDCTIHDLPEDMTASPPAHGGRIHPKTKAAAIADIQRGHTRTEVANRYNIDPGTLNTWGARPRAFNGPRLAKWLLERGIGVKGHRTTTYHSVHNWKRGARSPRLPTVRSILTAHGLSIDDLPEEVYER